eukprot:15355607-Ditylum_brightwellii.AAC.1
MAAIMMKKFVLSFMPMMTYLVVAAVVNRCHNDEEICLFLHANINLFVLFGVAAVVNGCTNDEGI